MINPPTVREVLYRSDDEADDDTAEALASVIVDMGDLKGVGHVLSAIAAFDSPFGPGGQRNMGTRLCSLLLPFVDEAFNTETRGSVVYKVMEALISAEVDASDLQAFLGRCADIVAAEADDNDKDHAPRLALLLGAHSSSGPEFLALLRDRLGDDLLLNRMSSSHSIEARTAYLRLATALRRFQDDEFVERFVDENRGWRRVLLEGLQAGDGLAALKAINAYFIAMQDAPGYWEPVTDLLREVEKTPRGWAERLRRLYQPGQVAQALDMLRRLSPPLAHACLTELDQLMRPKGSQTAFRAATQVRPARPARPTEPVVLNPRRPTPNDLVRAQGRRRERDAEAERMLPGVLRLIRGAFVPTTEAMELVRTVQRIDVKRGDVLGTMFAEGAGWQHRARDIVETDNPMLLGDLLRATVETGAEMPRPLVDGALRTWTGQAQLLRSPNAVQSLLRGFAAYYDDGTTAREWSSRLLIDRISDRVGGGLVHDLKRAAMLIRAMDVWGVPGAARRLAYSMPMNATVKVGAISAAKLLAALETVAPDLAHEHATVAATGIRARAADAFLIRPNQHWDVLGWLIRTIRRCTGVIDSDLGLTEVLDNIHQPRLRAWVEGCLGQDLDDGVFAETDPDELATWPLSARAARLIVRSDQARLDRSHAQEFSEILYSVGSRWQQELLRCATGDPVLRELFRPEHVSYLTESSRYVLSIGQPWGAETLALLPPGRDDVASSAA